MDTNTFIRMIATLSAIVFIGVSLLYPAWLDKLAVPITLSIGLVLTATLIDIIKMIKEQL